MIRKQEIGNALLDGILMAAVGAHQLSLADLRFQQQTVQFAEQLLIGLEFVCGWWRGRESGKAELGEEEVRKGLGYFLVEWAR